MMSGTKRGASAGLDPEGVITPPFDFDNRSVTQTHVGLALFEFTCDPVVLGCTCIMGGGI